MRRGYTMLAALAFAAFAATAAGFAAPLPPIPVSDPCGRVVEASFVPDAFIVGQPGMSGTLGVDRTVPAHFRVVIDQVSGIAPEIAARVNEAVFFRGGGTPPSRVALQLASTDAQLFADVRTVCVRGYAVQGDEGSTWTHFRELIRNPPSLPRAR
jgi:hypothetical protein